MASLYSTRHHRDIAALLNSEYAVAQDNSRRRGSKAERQQVERLIHIFTCHFQMDNPRFDRLRFLEATGLKLEEKA